MQCHYIDHFCGKRFSLPKIILQDNFKLESLNAGYIIDHIQSHKVTLESISQRSYFIWSILFDRNMNKLCVNLEEEQMN